MSSWDSDEGDELLDEATGAAGLKDEEDYDEDALLGVGEEEGVPHTTHTSSGFDEDDPPLGDEYDEGQDDPVNDGDDMVEIEVTGDVGDSLVIGVNPEEEAGLLGDFGDAGLEEQQMAQEPVISTIEHVDAPMEEDQTNEEESAEGVEESQGEGEEETESDKEGERAEDEEDSDDEEEEKSGERGRFRSERKENEISAIRTVSTTKPIPDTLPEVSVEQENQILRFGNDNRRNNRRGGFRGGFRGGPNRGMMGGSGPRDQWGRGQFRPPLMSQMPPPVSSHKILINPHFQGRIEAHGSVLLQKPPPTGMPDPGVRMGMQSQQQMPLFSQPPNIQPYNRPLISWSGPGAQINQQSQQQSPSLFNQRFFQPQQQRNIFNPGPQMGFAGQQPPQRQSLMHPPPSLSTLHPNPLRQSNQIGGEGGILFGQPTPGAPRVHWEGNIPRANQGQPFRFGAPPQQQQRQPFRFGASPQKQEPAGERIQTIQTVVGTNRRSQLPPRQQQIPQQRNAGHQQQLRGRSPAPSPQQLPRRSVKDRLGARPAVTPPQPQHGATAQPRLKRKSSDSAPAPSKPKVPRPQTSLDEPDEYAKKLEQQKLVREKLMAMKEKKRQAAAEQRRRELEERLAGEGKTIEDISGEPVSVTPQLQQQRSVQPQVVTNKQGKQVVRMTRSQHQHLVQQGVMAQGQAQVPRNVLRLPGAVQQHRPALAQPVAQPNRFPMNATQRGVIRARGVPGRGVTPKSGGRGNILQQGNPQIVSSSAPGVPRQGQTAGVLTRAKLNRIRTTGATQSQAGVTSTRGRGRTLSIMSGSSQHQQSAVRPATNRQVLSPGKVRPNGVSVRGGAQRGRAVSARLGPALNAGGGAGEIIIPGAGPEPFRRAGSRPDGLTGGSGDASPTTVQISSIPVGAVGQVYKIARNVSSGAKNFGLNEMTNTATVEFPTKREASKFRQVADRRMINMGVIHVDIIESTH